MARSYSQVKAKHDGARFRLRASDNVSPARFSVGLSSDCVKWCARAITRLMSSGTSKRGPITAANAENSDGYCYGWFEIVACCGEGKGSCFWIIRFRISDYDPTPH
jgi:hypothetical protein